MERIFLIISIVLLLSSCKTKIIDNDNDNDNEELIIVNKALLVAKPQYIGMNILSEPDNKDIIRFKNGGFIDDENNLYRDKFNFKINKISRWNKNIGLYNKGLTEKIKLIDDYYKIKKVSHNELEKFITILSISNVMFSDNGKLAIVNIGTFSNIEHGDYEGHMYVFKKEGKKWIFFLII